MMHDLAIYGAGGLGREVALMLKQINTYKPEWNVIGFFDDGKIKTEVIDGLEVVGGIKEINGWKKKLSLCIAIADPVTRESISSKIDNKNIMYPSLIHPASNTGSKDNRIGKGCIITQGCIFTTGIVLGDFVIINLLTTIGHDVTIGSFGSVMPGCSISGNVTIGSGTLIGTGVRILQNLSIGKYCKIGAGAVITKNFGDRLTVVGVPGKVRNK